MLIFQHRHSLSKRWLVIQFNADGSLAVKKSVPRDHIQLFALLKELSFPVGKKLFVQLLRGEKNARISRLQLDKNAHFGCLGGYQEEELNTFLDFLLGKEFLVIQKHQGRYPVLHLTSKGEKEFVDREHSYKVDEVELSFQAPSLHQYAVTPITSEHQSLMDVHADFLQRFTVEQQQAIVALEAKQLCIAGAGSGKTSVLTHKIAYLVKFCNVSPSEILAITFTRKAKQEMKHRLEQLLGSSSVRIETFNSFAEKELLAKGFQLYGKEKQMASSKEFVRIVISSLQKLGQSVDTFMRQYFTSKEQKGKEPRELFFSFLYDFRAIFDGYVQQPSFKEYIPILDKAPLTEKIVATTILKLCEEVYQALHEQGLRTYSNQLVDVTALYEQYPSSRRNYKWILVDEYQDVNVLQVQLLEQLAPSHLFVVGDPRQSIYAWRGSDPEMIYRFIAPETAVFELTTNFRSTSQVVSLANELISNSFKGHNSFAPMTAFDTRTGLVSLVRFATEQTEAIAVVSQIKELAVARNDIFVLARTNKALDKIQEQLAREQIDFVVRTEEKKSVDISQQKDKVVLSTVHAAKGLEAEIVFLVGVTMNLYPCKAKDHRFVTLLSTKDDYDSYEEERRILYVACTRAKKELRMSYAGSPSPFFAQNVLSCCTHRVQEQQTRIFQSSAQREDVVEQQRQALRRWRYLEAQERGVPAYMIFSDRALDHLLELQPLTVEELEEVSGFGKTKIAEFGKDILHIMYR